ncbi:MAG: hypothetical protein RMJ51_06640 [Candidatus Calescibacterium sp.]|nr:hypothetical protein [Candidatus Calescibacterium sp.]MCX7758400.1 hypothetical protein [bacterium]MDW8195894.1 hypothetical protein [Candidatus Calescibacterium sp.]
MVNPIQPGTSANTLRDIFVESKNVVPDTHQEKLSKDSQTEITDQTISDVFTSQESKDEIIKKIDQIINQKENELKKIEEEIKKVKDRYSSRNISDDNLKQYLQVSDQIILENLNMQRQSLMNQINVLDARKRELLNQKKEEERNIEALQQEIRNNYQISLDQLESLKKQLLSYQESMNANYQKNIEALNNNIKKLQKEIEDLLSSQPSTPEEAEQIAQKISEKRNLISILKGQMDLLSQEISNINNQIGQQITQLDQQAGEIRKQMQADYYNKWAIEQAIRREVEQIIWSEMLNEKNHVANLWKMYFDTNQKINAMWRDMYFKKIQDNNDFVLRWSKALGA